MTLNTKLMNNKILFLFLACCLFSGCMDMDKKRNNGGGNPDIILLGEQKELGISFSHDYTVYMKVLKTVHSSDSGMMVVVSNALDVPMRYGEGGNYRNIPGMLGLIKVIERILMDLMGFFLLGEVAF